jgi:hypothetical protein
MEAYCAAAGVLESRDLAICHLLGHVKKETSVTFFDAAQEPAETTQIARFLTGTAPRNVVRTLALGKIGQFGWLFAVVEKLVEWNFHGPSQFFESFDRGNGMAILDARNVAAKQPSALLDVALRQFFCFTKQAYTVTNYHVRHCFTDELVLQVKKGNR